MSVFGRCWYSIQQVEKEVLLSFTLGESIEGLVDLFHFENHNQTVQILPLSPHRVWPQCGQGVNI